MLKAFCFILLILTCLAFSNKDVNKKINDIKLKQSFNNKSYSEQIIILYTNYELSVKENDIGLASGILFEISNLYSEKGYFDSSEVVFLKSIELLEPTSDFNQKGFAYYYLGNNFFNIGQIRKALSAYHSSNNYFIKAGNKEFEAELNVSIGFTNIELGNYKNVIENYQIALDIYEKLGNREKIGDLFNGFSNLYIMMGNFEKSLKYAYKSLKINIENNDTANIINDYKDISIIYSRLKHTDSSDYYLNKAIYLSKVSKNYLNLGILYETKAKKYFSINFDSCSYYYELALKNLEIINHKQGVTHILIQLSEFYNSNNYYGKAFYMCNKAIEIAESINDERTLNRAYNILGYNYMKQDKFDEAILYFEKSLELSKKNQSSNFTLISLKNLSKLFKIKGNISKSLLYLEEYANTNDSIYSIEGRKAIEEMQTKYETEKNEKEIELLNKDKALQEAELKKQTFIRNSFIIGFLFIIIIAVGIYNRYLIKRKANIELAEQNAIITQQKEEISSQRDEITCQRDLLDVKKKEVEVIFKEQTDSILYAKQMQVSILPSNDVLNKLFPEYFILFMPRNIVSGDFYWATEVNNYKIFCVADCTGHGVPGAFMSMLGISFLNEIVNDKEIIQPNIILKELRKSIVNAMQQKGVMGEQKDGMDISIIAIKPQEPSFKFQVSSKEESVKVSISTSSITEGGSDKYSVIGEQSANADSNQSNQKNQSKICDSDIFHAQWSGANNPLWIVSSLMFDVSGSTENEQIASANIKHQTTNIRLFEFKPDKMPISIYEKMDDFTNHDFILNKNDTVYILTDGFVDQFGGELNKKFMTKSLKELLVSIASKEMNEQQNILNYTINNWMGFNEQVDDITIMGVKI